MYDANIDYYLAPIPFIIANFIYEYDISKANINVLLYKGIINQDQYNLISTFSREKRQIYCGNLQQDKSVSLALSEGLAEFRRRLITANNITEERLLSVKKDAMFILGSPLKIVNFDNITFALKNIYTSFYKINNLEVYYFLDQVFDKEIIDVKGIKDTILELHKDGFLSFLCKVFESNQCNTLENSIAIIKDFEASYVNKLLPIEFYREFNAESCYRISRGKGDAFLLNTVNTGNLNYVNINYNLDIIKTLYGIVSSIYFQTR